MIFGKLIAGYLGWLTGGAIGLVIGVFVGNLFDKALRNAMGFASPENLARIQQTFFETTFLLSGYLAKADGRVSEQEIAHTEQVFAQLGLNRAQRQQAIELFRQGSEPGFQFEPVVAAFVQTCGRQRQLQQTLVLFLISLAHADQTLDPKERATLVRISSLLGMREMQLQVLLNMARAQEHFYSGGPRSAGIETSLEDAYGALGVSGDVSDKELKRAYRKLMSENHPDKLIAKGVPEYMIKLATERSQEIQSAYEMVRRHRGARK